MPNSSKRKGAPRRAPSPGHRADVADVLARLFAGRREVQAGKMFGFPAFYTGGRLFACVYGNGVGLKLPAETVRALEGKPGIAPFQPYGMAKMTEWVQITRAHAEDYAGDRNLLQASADFLGGGKALRKRSSGRASAPRAARASPGTAGGADTRRNTRRRPS